MPETSSANKSSISNKTVRSGTIYDLKMQGVVVRASNVSRS